MRHSFVLVFVHRIILANRCFLPAVMGRGRGREGEDGGGDGHSAGGGMAGGDPRALQLPVATDDVLGAADRHTSGV